MSAGLTASSAPSPLDVEPRLDLFELAVPTHPIRPAKPKIPSRTDHRVRSAAQLPDPTPAHKGDETLTEDLCLLPVLPRGRLCGRRRHS
jgi:hypothetical protein